MALLSVAACQIDTVLGDLAGNVAKLAEAFAEADRAGCDLAVGPELAITGYPPEDLVLKPRFVDDNVAALDALADATRDLSCACVAGYVQRRTDDLSRKPDAALATDSWSRNRGTGLHNAAALLHRGKVVGSYAKHLLPNYAVFDEKRYFDPGPLGQPLFLIGGVAVGVLICEDIWEPEPAGNSAQLGASLLVVLNGSPYYRGRRAEREEIVSVRARESGCHVLYVNLVGGQDELVFDGASMLVDPCGSIVARAHQFREEVMVVEVDLVVAGDRLGEKPDHIAVTRIRRPSAVTTRAEPQVLKPMGDVEEVYEALVLGTRDYALKNNFSGALVALSGGIDSSLVAVVAADALGAENVHGVAMPSRYSSEASVVDAQDLATRLGLDFRIVPIEAAHASFMSMVGGEGAVDLAEENLQSRIRAVAIMYLSNRNGWIVLTTGNKSELAVGYSTLYGDTAGGFAVIKDVPKTLVYELARFRNRIGVESPDRFPASRGAEAIPVSVLDKPPSAELRPDQRDDQFLPPYEILDPVLEAYVEGDRTLDELIEGGVDTELATRVAHLVDLAEYKRRQNPPGVRVSPKAFGKDRRMPITNRYSSNRGRKP